MRPLSAFYGGTFADSMNFLYAPKNIAQTAAKVRELEKTLGPFVFGKFHKHLLPDPSQWNDPRTGVAFDTWEENYVEIPEHFRQRLTDVMGSNFHSANPLPMFVRVTENVDASHDVIIRPFTHNGFLYIGILVLCPNTRLP